LKEKDYKMQKSTTENLVLNPSKIRREAMSNHSSGPRSISHSVFVQYIVLKNRSQFLRRFISRGVLFEKNRVHFTYGCRSRVSLRKTAVSFPCEETAAWLSTSLLLASPKDRARSVSETFFLSDTPSLISGRN